MWPLLTSAGRSPVAKIDATARSQPNRSIRSGKCLKNARHDDARELERDAPWPGARFQHPAARPNPLVEQPAVDLGVDAVHRGGFQPRPLALAVLVVPASEMHRVVAQATDATSVARCRSS